MSESPMEEQRRRMREHDRQVARIGGHPPRGEEHRAWVDHDGLQALSPGEPAWKLHIGFTGLGGLDVRDPAVPPAVRALVTLHDGGDGARLLAMFAGLVLVYVGVVVAMLGMAAPLDEALVRGLFASGLAVPVLFAFAPVAWHALWERGFGRSAPGSRERIRDRALAELRARPFVVRVGDMLLENLPSLSQLQTWSNELRAAEAEADVRTTELLGLRTRLDAVASDLGQDPRSAHGDALTQAIGREQQLIARAKALRGRVEGELRALEAQLVEIRGFAELDALRSRAEAAVGAVATEPTLRVQTALELDLGDLAREVGALRDDLRDERDRGRALAETGAVGVRAAPAGPSVSPHRR